jgi:hypothetical protein
MTYNIEFAYIDDKAKEAYEKFGGFATKERLLFLGMEREGLGLVTGIHMRGGLYRQIGKHSICCGLMVNNNLIPSKYNKFLSRKAPAYCGLHATHLHIPTLLLPKSLDKSYLEKRAEFSSYVKNSNPLFEYVPNGIEINPILIDYQSSKTLPYN